MASFGEARAEVPPEHFSQKGRVLIAADRLFGVSNYSLTKNQNGREQTVSGTTVDLLWGNSDVPGLGSNPYTTPRLGVDYAVIDGVTVGGSLGYTSISGKTESNGQSSERPSTATFSGMGRVGYVVPLGRHGLWLRGGFTYFNATTTTPSVSGSSSKSSVNGFSFALEPTFVFTPIDHVALTGSLILDFPLSGSSDSNGQAVDTKITNYGGMVGVLTYF